MLNESPGIKIFALGAVNGIIFGALLEIVLRSLFVYGKYLRSLEPKGGFSISYSPYPFSWWFLPLSFFVFVAVAAFLTHLCFAKYIKSTVWFWQIVGVTAALNYVLFTIPYVFYHYSLIESGLEYTESITSDIQANLYQILIIYPALAAFNLIFALVLKRRNLNFS